MTNMKKTYISPEMDIVELMNQQSLLAGSVLEINTDPVEVGNADAPLLIEDEVLEVEL